MNRWVLVVLVILVLYAVGTTLMLMRRHDVGADEGQPLEWIECSEEDVGPVAIPDGEWWGIARDFTVVVLMDGARGLAEVATKSGNILFEVYLTYPDIQVAPDLEVPNIDAPIYVFHNPQYRSDWAVTVPGSEPESETGPFPEENDDFGRMKVDNIQGSFGAGQPPFNLFRTKVRKPEGYCGDTGGPIRIIRRLRGLVAEARKARTKRKK